MRAILQTPVCENITLYLKVSVVILFCNQERKTGCISSLEPGSNLVESSVSEDPFHLAPQCCGNLEIKVPQQERELFTMGELREVPG